MKKVLALFGFSAVVLVLQSAAAANVYFNIPVASLALTEGSLPANGGNDVSKNWQRSWQMMELLQPYAALDGDGEAYISGDNPNPWASRIGGDSETISISAPEGKDVTGRLFVPKTDSSGMVQVRFKIFAKDAKPEAKESFLKAKQDFYKRLQNRNIPGAAWFRHQANVTAKERNTNAVADEDFSTRFNPQRVSELDDTFTLFSGGRALSENLQLDRALPATGRTNGESVAITNINSITVQAMDWKPLLAAKKPELDPLAAFIPADQHALFFPSFQAMTDLIDEADANGTPILQMLEPQSEDANSRGRYQKQLCLGLNELSRLLGPQVVSSTAFTGSDPFLRVGTDVAILFEAKNPQLIQLNVTAQQAAARAANPAAKSVSGDIEDVHFVGVVSPDRSVSSYMTAVSNVVFVSNSLKQLENLVRVAQGKSPALSSQDEYIYFRQKYPRGEKTETAFLVLSDATIRRWCGPQWRIADSRRTRVAAVLAESEAAHLDELASGKITNAVLQPAFSVPELGELRLTPAGVSSAHYGSLGFMTPIAEISPTTVTRDEATAYERWRDNYQRNWSQYFDPIAVRFSISQKHLGVELTVMPLITGSRYNPYVDFTSGAQIAAGAGDPHTNTLARLALAINPQSRSIQEAGSFVGNFAPGLLKANPFGWLGQSITLYADDDPFWNELTSATNIDEFMDHSYARLPIALHCEVKNALGVTAFLTSLHAFADQSAPGMAVWQNLDYNGKSYVKVAPAKLSQQSRPGDDWSVYYAVTPDSLTVTMSETLLKRALDRRGAGVPTNTVAIPGAMPWLGSNICFQVDRKLIDVMLKATRDDYQLHLQTLAWNNLPILNEWKRLYPDKDPVKLHEELWGTKLICPGGGTFVWNEKWHTMESTAFGNPAEPKTNSFASPLMALIGANLGLTFENQGMSAKVVVERNPAK